ncbi:ATP-binding protein [Ammoniphilus sp. 3BR4]|uniref:ATP-binding protein n=1 Tax=Ammoniphilus sp. 3BR4 TaxID=3158265 RepID=UPI003465A9AC
MRLQTKLILLIGSLILLVICITGITYEYMLENTLKEQIGIRALEVAKTVALVPEIHDAFSEPEPWKIIQPIVDKIEDGTGAEFIVVGNQEGIRYSHPKSGQIGKEMVGGDNRLVLEGQSIISEAVGTLGPSLRGKTPILDESGQVIGLVSVGFLLEDIDRLEVAHRKRMIFFGGIALAIGILGALLISRNVKKAILGLEPEEITRLYQEKKAIIQSIREGIVAVNAEGVITTANRNAISRAGFTQETDLIGKRVMDIFPGSNILRVIHSGKAEYDQEVLIGDQTVVANRLPILDKHQKVLGVVSSFRPKSELYRLAQELAHVKQYAEALRAQTHEYSNKLYMIYGLIQLESYQEAIEVITNEVDIHQNLIPFIMQEIPDPMIGGLLLGKFNQAKELKVDLEIDRESSFGDIPPVLDRSDLVTILGNLIQNGLEAVLSQPVKKVSVSLTDIGNDLIMEVEDTGPGIPDEHVSKIFENDFSTKSTKNRGIGLALVHQAVDKWNGFITYSRSTAGGSIFTVVIPKDGRGEMNDSGSYH